MRFLLFLMLLVLISCQSNATNDTELLLQLEDLITSNEWFHFEPASNETDWASEPNAIRDPLDVLSQFKTVQNISVGEQHLLEFLYSDQSDFINRIDNGTADSLFNQVTHRLLPSADAVVCRTWTRRYRTLNGTCNNPEHPERGMTEFPLRRFLPSEYDDGKKEPRRSVTGSALPSARAVSLAVTDDDNNYVASGYTTLMFHFGQFLSHDLDQVPQVSGSCYNCRTSEVCLPILIPRGDPLFVDQSCIPFLRSVGKPSPGGHQPWAYQQTNHITSYLDASMVYGSKTKTMRSIRVPGDPQGLMLVTPNPRRGGKDLLPSDTDIHHCAGQTYHRSCGKAGDSRAAEQVGLTALHTVWLREHNRIARELSRVNAHWRGGRIFREARKILGAEWQHIVYNEYLPLLLGGSVSKRYGLDVNQETEYHYDVDTDATIQNGFATAAFRLHSQIPTTIWRVDPYFKQVFPDIKMKEAFFNATHVFDVDNDGPESVLRGMLVQPLNKMDHFFSSAVTKHLFGDPKAGFGLDLIALNIQRSRDHGLPGYVRYREELCGLDPISNWAELTRVVPQRIVQRLSYIYSSVDDIDPFVGFFAETPLPGALVGPTLACLIAKQFSFLKQGDRFWYENKEGQQAFTEDQRNEIRKASMARVLCDNTDGLREIQPYAFLTAETEELQNTLVRSAVRRRLRCRIRGGDWRKRRRCWGRGASVGSSRTPSDPSRRQARYTSFVAYSRLHRYPDGYGRLSGYINRRTSCLDEAKIPRIDLTAWAEY